MSDYNEKRSKIDYVIRIKENHPTVVSWLSFAGLNFISMLAIMLPYFQVWLSKSTNDYNMQGLGGFAWFVQTTAIQEILIIPVTVIVIVVYRILSRIMKLPIVNQIGQIFISFMLNTIAANAVILVFTVGYPIYNDFSSYQLSHNLIVTIKNESIKPSTNSQYDGYFYHATLHIENNSEQKIPANVLLNITGDSMKVQNERQWARTLADGWISKKIARGSSDIMIDIPIYTNHQHGEDTYYLDCNDEALTKSLYLRYALPYNYKYYGYLPIGNNINQRWRELLCSEK